MSKRLQKIDRALAVIPLGRAIAGADLLSPFKAETVYQLDGEGEVSGIRHNHDQMDCCPECGEKNRRIFENQSFFFAPCACGNGKWERR
jgi:hypothetical protein